MPTSYAPSWSTISSVLASVVTAGTVVAGGWNYVGKPWAQGLINETVDSRLDELEAAQQATTNALEELRAGQMQEAAQSRGEAAALTEIRCLLRAQSDPQLAPDDCPGGR